MVPGWLLCGLLLVGSRSVAQDAASPAGETDAAVLAFGPALPEAVPDVSGWEVVTGEFATERLRGSYRFYVSPRRRALYQLMRYRLQILQPSSDWERERSSAERVFWNPEPGRRQPLLCWQREDGDRPGWRALGSGTPEYRSEVGLLLQLLAVHRAARAAQASGP